MSDQGMDPGLPREVVDPKPKTMRNVALYYSYILEPRDLYKLAMCMMDLALEELIDEEEKGKRS